MACSTGPHICTEKVNSGVTLVGWYFTFNIDLVIALAVWFKSTMFSFLQQTYKTTARWQKKGVWCTSKRWIWRRRRRRRTRKRRRMCTSRGSWSEVAVDSPGYLQCPLSFSSSFLPDRVTASRYSQADSRLWPRRCCVTTYRTKPSQAVSDHFLSLRLRDGLRELQRPSHG